MQAVIDSDNPRVRRGKRSDLWYVESTEAPRPPDVCERFAGKVEPWFGFAVYGVLYLFVALTVAAIASVPVFLIGAAAGAKGATWVEVLAAIAATIGFALAWWAFVRWARRKRAAALPLVRDGELVEGTVVDKLSGGAATVAGRVVVDAAVGRLGIKFYRVELSHGGAPRMLHVPITGYTRPRSGAPLSVLFHPACKHALVFDETGDAQVARVR